MKRAPGFWNASRELHVENVRKNMNPLMPLFPGIVRRETEQERMRSAAMDAYIRSRSTPIRRLKAWLTAVFAKRNHT